MAHVLDGRATLEILFDLGCVFAVESFQFLVELHVALIDVIDVGVLVKCTTATVLASLGDPTQIGYTDRHARRHQACYQDSLLQDQDHRG